MSGAGPAGRARGPATLVLAAAGLALGGWGVLRARVADPGAYRPASLAEAEAGRPFPALVAVRGRVVTEAAVRFGPEDRLRFWFPLVSESWTPGAPVAALVLDPGGPALGGVTFRARLQGSHVPAPVREALASRGISLAPRVQVLDAAPPDRADSRRGWLGAGAGAALVAAAAALALRRL